MADNINKPIVFNTPIDEIDIFIRFHHPAIWKYLTDNHETIYIIVIIDPNTFRISHFDVWKNNFVNNKFINHISNALLDSGMANVKILNYPKYCSFLDIFDDLKNIENF